MPKVSPDGARIDFEEQHITAKPPEAKPKVNQAEKAKEKAQSDAKDAIDKQMVDVKATQFELKYKTGQMNHQELTKIAAGNHPKYNDKRDVQAARRVLRSLPQ